jgi:hypothetical protein
MTLMAVGGYASEMQRRGKAGNAAVFATPPPPRVTPSLSHSSSNGSSNSAAAATGGGGSQIDSSSSGAGSGLRYMKFPLPVVDSAAIYSPAVSAPGCGVAVTPKDGSVGSGNGKESQSSASVITVVCVNFHHIEEVVRLWLDNVKIFSDFASSEPAEVSKNATFCLKVRADCIALIAD